MRICLQAGHKGLTSGSTGASGERDWNTKIVPMIAERLRNSGVEVYETDALAYNDDTVVETDWNLFLAVHYDADIYNDTGGFIDYPEPSTDYSTAESQRIAKVLADYYFPATGIKYVNRSNANTRYYYMWKYLTKNTPCVLIECGVGWRKPEDYETLRKYDFIADTICNGILKALGLKTFLDEDIPTSVEDAHNLKDVERYNKYWSYNELINDWVIVAKDLKYKNEQLDACRTDNISLRQIINEQAEEIAKLKNEILVLDKDKANLRSEIAQLQGQFAEVSRERDSLLDCCKGYEISVPKLNAYIRELEDKLISQDPLKDFTAKELWNALFDKIFRK